MGALLGENGLDRRPHKVSDTKGCDAWWYENTDGLRFYSRTDAGIVSFTVKWQSVAASVRRWVASKLMRHGKKFSKGGKANA